MWSGQDGNVSGGFSSPGGFVSTQGEQSQKQGARRVQNLIPCTLAQLTTAENDGDTFSLHGTEINQVTVVGRVVSAKEVETRYDYELDDRTGVVMQVRQFIDNDENQSERTPMMIVNTYVRVFGHVRAFGGKTSLVAFRMQPVEDMNELTTHLLEVVKTGAFLKRRLEGRPSFGGDNNMSVSYPGQEPAVRGNSISDQVHALIRSCQEMQGITIQQICSQLRGLPEKAVRDAVEFLSSEGHIYSTVDEDHFKTTD